MFLAWNEIKRNKLRFILIIGVLMLVAYLVFFLSGLANGLKNMNREAVDKWNADAIILTAESDKNLPQSNFMKTDLNDINADEQANLTVLSAIAGKGDDKKNVFVFGIEQDSFIMPNITEGKKYQEKNEVIASDALKNDGFKLGDKIQLSSTDVHLKIVGFTDIARFSAAPVLYGDISEVNKIKINEETNESLNAIIIKDSDSKNIEVSDKFEVIEIETFIQKLPGYSEQNLTLTFMIYFLFVISAVIIAIFLYVLTVQKISMFGIMKAQGISNSYLAKSVVAQTFILASVGVVVGFVLAILTGMGIPDAVPVSFDISTMIIYGVILILTAILGAIFSVFTIVRIDPLEAIGG